MLWCIDVDISRAYYPRTISSHHLLPSSPSTSVIPLSHHIPLPHRGAVPVCSITYNILPSCHFLFHILSLHSTIDITPLYVIIPLGGEGKKRPVLDAVHDRDTGKMRIRVNDGREINTTNGAVVEIALADVGIVLFNPRTMVRHVNKFVSQCCSLVSCS